jgi:hypothetical protein
MTEPLRVDTAELVKAGRVCAERAGKLTEAAAAEPGGSECQASTVMLTGLLAEAVNDRAAWATRLRATDTALRAGGAAYDETDAGAAGSLGGQLR